MSWLEPTEALVPIEAVQPGDQIRVDGVWLTVDEIKGAPGGRWLRCGTGWYMARHKAMRLARAAP